MPYDFVSSAGIMSDVINVLALPAAHRAADAVVAMRSTGIVHQSQYLAAVQSWRDTLHKQAGQRFALYISDGLEFASAMIGAWHAGKTVYIPSDVLPATCEALKQTVDGFIGDFPEDCAPLHPGDNAGVATAALPPLHADFVGVVVYTSGSTGAPQAIPKRLGQLAAEVATLERLFGEMAGNAQIVATVSHQHIYGLLFKILWPLASGRLLHASSFAYPEELLPLTTNQPCVLISSPAHLTRLPQSLGWQEATHHVRMTFSSGGPLPEDAALQMAAMTGAAPIEVFGSSETGGIAWRQRSGGDAWTVMPQIEWRTSEDGKVLEIRSPHLFDDEWYQTADRAEAIDGKRFMLKGRADRLVKIAEKRISLDAIERLLLASPWVALAKVVPVEGVRFQLAAYVVLNDAGRMQLAQRGKPALNIALRALLSSTIERVGLPRRWHYLDTMPVNAQGKTTVAMLNSLGERGENVVLRPTMPSARLLQRDDSRACFELTAPANLLYFDGHFDDMPILPGVVQVDWAIALGRDCFALPPRFAGLHALKFQRVIQPEQLVHLELEHDAAKGSLSFRYVSSAGQHASGRIVFGDAGV
jgi:acyl-coenzyme A synthetase/AMP-(fatty) acid ligase/3-hydroxymyristoyl/3-hydroxydecanoyl-(acyl carrier protein) dehydratase